MGDWGYDRMDSLGRELIIGLIFSRTRCIHMGIILRPDIPDSLFLLAPAGRLFLASLPCQLKSYRGLMGS